MDIRISKYKSKDSLLLLIFAVFFAFFGITLITSFFITPEGINLLAIIVACIVSVGALILLSIGIYNYVYRKKIIKELSDCNKIELEIIGFIDSDKLKYDSSYCYRKYIIGYNKNNDKYYRSNGHHKNPEIRYTVGDKINMLFKSDDSFFILTDEYIKNKR